jgi:hypothetical protein
MLGDPVRVRRPGREACNPESFTLMTSKLRSGSRHRVISRLRGSRKDPSARPSTRNQARQRGCGGYCRQRVRAGNRISRSHWESRTGQCGGDILRIKAEFPVNLWPNAAQALATLGARVDRGKQALFSE